MDEREMKVEVSDMKHRRRKTFTKRERTDHSTENNQTITDVHCNDVDFPCVLYHDLNAKRSRKNVANNSCVTTRLRHVCATARGALGVTEVRFIVTFILARPLFSLHL